MKEIGRMLTAMVTPFTDSGEVDYPQARKLALALLDSGSDGVVVVGTTGESPTLVREEEYRLFREVKEAVAHRGVVIAGTGSNSTAEAVASTVEAEKIGVDGVLQVVPYYNKPTQEGLYRHFKAVAESTSLPIILYNVPSRTITNLAVDTLVRLAEISNIVGVKEASADMEQVAHIIRRTRDDFRVWSGNDSDTFNIMALGGYGVVSVTAHLVGKQNRQLINHMVAGNMEEAAALHRHLLPLVNAMFIVSNPSPVKYAVNQVGFRVGKPRLPLVEPDEKSAAAIRETLKNYTIDLPV